MAKYVEFDFENKKPIYYEVSDFDIETIKSLPSYKDKWLQMIFLDGEKRMFDGEILDIFPGEVIKRVYWGKKISYSEVKRIVGNDLKYKDLLFNMNVACRNSFSSRNIEFKSEEDYRDRLDKFCEEYDRNHFCLFRVPNFFGAYAFNDNNAITIEEFDETVKLDFGRELKNVENNTVAGEEYIKEHKFILELFNHYFDMLHKSCRLYPDDTIGIIFEVCFFHFENFKNLGTLEEINFFLDICDYTYNLSRYSNDLFKKYRDFINDYYRQLEYGEEPKV